jgi:hypothetical protein
MGVAISDQYHFVRGGTTERNALHRRAAKTQRAAEDSYYTLTRTARSAVLSAVAPLCEDSSLHLITSDLATQIQFAKKCLCLCEPYQVPARGIFRRVRE